jgi:hypothetical protein
MNSGTSRRFGTAKTGLFAQIRDVASPVRAPVVGDARVRQYIAPERVLWHQGGLAGPERLLAPETRPTPADQNPCVLASGAALLVDFGRELNAGVQLVTAAQGERRSATVRLRFGESADEAMHEAGSDAGLHDLTLTVPWGTSLEVGQTGFRFVRLDVAADGAPLALVALRAVSIERDLPRLGAFRCNDARINAVWDLSARTVDLLMQDHLYGDLKRYRSPALADLLPLVSAVAGLHGDHAVVRDSLDALKPALAEAERANHALEAATWLSAQALWYRRTGNFTWLADQRDAVVRHATRLADAVEGRGQPLQAQPWDPTLAEDAAGSTICFVLRAITDALELCRAMGDDAVVQQLDRAAGHLGRLPLPIMASKGAVALAVLANRRDPVEANRSVLAVAPGHGLSPFTASLVLAARGRAGDARGGLELLRTLWGGLLDSGATTCWEIFPAAWSVPCALDAVERAEHPLRGQGASIGLCHGRATGAIPWLIEHVAGIMPHAPGYRSVRIVPHLGDLAWVEATVPTPHGVITVRHERRLDGSLHTSSTLPHGVTRID